ncbi:hypothetical protein P8452_25139 [Trifolium repens]|nr:hypothetical protein P8452_25139 [Trifolium repens]
MFQSLSLPKLNRAVITESLWSHFPLKALSTVKSLSLDTLKLYAHDQTDDEGDDDEENQQQRNYIDIPIFHNLTHLKLHNSWDLVVQMLHHCPKLQSLELSKGLVQNRGREDDHENLVEEPELVPQCVSSCLRTCTVRNVVEHLTAEDHRAYKVNQLQRPCDDVPIFHNLTHLELHNRWDLVVQVLHQCPKLQNLRLHKGVSDAMGNEDFNQENWVEPEFVPECLLSSFTTFTIVDFSDLKSARWPPQHVKFHFVLKYRLYLGL